MTSDTRREWESLLQVCKTSGLPVPELYPSSLGENYICRIPDPVGWHSSAKSVKEAVVPCLDFAYGYQFRMNQEKKAQEEAEKPVGDIENARECAQLVIESGGMSGPYDHVLLAKAILALTDSSFTPPRKESKHPKWDA